MIVSIELMLGLATAIGAWAVYVTFALRRLVWMHEHADQTKFGTVGFKEVIAANTTAIDKNTEMADSLIHYVKWAYRQQNGKEPPPYIPSSQ